MRLLFEDPELKKDCAKECATKRNFFQVLVKNAGIFTYQHPANEPTCSESSKALKPGTLVVVPVRKKLIAGIVLGQLDAPHAPDFHSKSIHYVSNIVFQESLLRFLMWSAHYTMTKEAFFLSLFAPSYITDTLVDEKRTKEKPLFFEPAFNLSDLTDDQEKAFISIKPHIGQKSFQTFLLDGVTGSGKTEVYFAVLKHIIELGGQALVLIPEIALTSQWVVRFTEKFGCAPFVYHSKVTLSQKRRLWNALLKGMPCIVVGARSALFLPFKKCLAIIVDEEHDPSYKQSTPPFYHARDLAIARSSIEKIPVILASATPSIETYANVMQKKYTHLSLNNRYGGASLPRVSVVDMGIKENPSLLLKEHIFGSSKKPHDFLSIQAHSQTKAALKRGEQVLFFMNRRGFAPIRLCKECGFKYTCPHCSGSASVTPEGLPLVSHEKPKPLLICHHCGFNLIPSNKCPSCDAQNTWIHFGKGIDRLFKDIQKSYPTFRILSLSSDISLSDLEKALEQIHKQEVDIILATQILAKGHHFPNLTTVIVVDADMGLLGIDPRGVERTYQILHQVGGRAGREEKEGLVILQTRYPKHPIIQALQNHDREALYEYELKGREEHGMPPFTRLVSVLLTSFNEEVLSYFVQQLANRLPCLEAYASVTVIGPMPSVIYMLNRQYRYRFLLKSISHKGLASYIQTWLQSCTLPASIRVRIDVDPYDFF